MTKKKKLHIKPTFCRRRAHDGDLFETAQPLRQNKNPDKTREQTSRERSKSSRCMSSRRKSKVFCADDHIRAPGNHRGAKLRQELTSLSHLPRHGVHLFDAIKNTKKCSSPLNAECFVSSYEQKEKTKNKTTIQRGYSRRNSQTMNTTKTAVFHDEDRTARQEDV